MRNRRAIACFVGAALLVVCRWAWEIRSPLHFDTVKSWIYVRDALTIGPAAALAVLGILLLKPMRQRWVDRPSVEVIGGLAIITFIGCFVISQFVLLGTPAVVDEAAYLWQGELLSHGHLSSAIPADPFGTIIEYIGDVRGRRVSVFFPGSALPLALGHALGLETLINPLLAAATVLITYWAGRRLFNDRVAIIGAALFALSPFMLFQGGSFFGQIWTALLLVPAMTMALRQQRRFEPVAIGFLVAATLFSRPVSAIVGGLVISAVWAAERDVKSFIKRGALAVGGGVVPLALFLLMNQHLTGEWLQTVHRQLLPNESAIVGVHNIKNATLNIVGFAIDANGLVLIGIALLLPALWSRSKIAWTVVLYALVHLGAYSLYYNHGISYGPRYLFEVTPLLTLVLAYGLTCIPKLNDRAPALVAVAAVLAVVGVVPTRAAVFHARASYLDLAPIAREVQHSTSGPALIFLTKGPYEFPDPMYPAFVANGETPEDNQLLYLRDDPLNRCQIMASHPDRQSFVVDEDSRAAGDPAWVAVVPLKPC